jgi:hypothetical protein
MKRRLLTPLLALAVAAVLVVAEVAAPRPVDTRPNYEHDATGLLGGAVLHAILPDLLGGAEVSVNQRSPYTHVRDASRAGETYFFLTHQFAPDSLLATQIIAYASRGNTVFIGAESVAGPLARMLGLHVTGAGAAFFEDATAADSTLFLHAPGLRRTGGYRLGDRVVASRFAQVDSARTTVLGSMTSGGPTYVRVRVGRGQVLVSLTPRAFGNFSLLDADGAQYVAAALAYLPRQHTVWDGAFKPQRNVGGSPLRFVHETPPLAWAFHTALIGALLFVGFRGRRWQRPIPVVRPPPNHAVGFAQSIARLWHERGDDRMLVERRARFLLERLRAALHDPDLDFSPEQRERVARRLGLPAGDVSMLFDLILRLRESRRIAPRDMLELDRRLDAIYARL